MDVAVLLRRSLREYAEDDGGTQAAAVAYYVLFSIVPLLALCITAAARLLGSSEEATNRVLELGRLILPTSQDFIRSLITSALANGGLVTGIGLVGFVWGGSQLFCVLEGALNVAWDAPARSWWRRRALGVMAVLGGLSLILMSFTARLVVGLFPQSTFSSWSSELLGGPLPFVLSLVLFTLMQKLIPNCTVSWRAAGLAGMATWLLFALAHELFNLYVEQFSKFDLLYGSIAGVVILMLWSFCGASIVILAAELASEVDARHRDENTGSPIIPR